MAKTSKLHILYWLTSTTFLDSKCRLEDYFQSRKKSVKDKSFPLTSRP